MYSLLWTAAGALGLWLGFPNTLVRLPVLVLLYPAALYALGIQARTRTHALRQGWLCGLAGASAALLWLTIPVQEVGGLPYALALPCALCIGAYVGLYGGIFSVCAFALKHHPARIPALGLLWYLLEHLRGAVLTGFPWLTPAAAFVPWTSMIQGASLIGAYGLSGLLAACACLLARPWAEPLYVHRWRSAAVGAFVLVLCAGLGAWRAASVPTENFALMPALPDHAFAVIMVEGNIDQNQKWEPALQQHTAEHYLRLSRKALLTYAARYPDMPTPLVIWPETAMPFYFQAHPHLTPRILNFAQETGAWLVLGAPGIQRNATSTTLYNRAFLVNPQGHQTAWYDKERLVPFGEFLPPILDFAFLAPLLQGVGTFTPGTDPQPLRADALALGVLICYEGIFPEIAHRRVAHGANVLLHLSNDGWFGNSAAPRQHLELTALRAVEQNRWIIRATNTGISALIDTVGRVVLEGEQFRAQALTGFAQRTEAHTVFFVVGAWLPLVAVMLLMLCLCVPSGRAGPGSCHKQKPGFPFV